MPEKESSVCSQPELPLRQPSQNCELLVDPERCARVDTFAFVVAVQALQYFQPQLQPEPINRRNDGKHVTAAANWNLHADCNLFRQPVLPCVASNSRSPSQRLATSVPRPRQLLVSSDTIFDASLFATSLTLQTRRFQSHNTLKSWLKKTRRGHATDHDTRLQPTEQRSTPPSYQPCTEHSNRLNRSRDHSSASSAGLTASKRALAALICRGQVRIHI